ncbi:MAG TPA: glycosyl hydrolase 115 family protein [Lachnospiraceae bacterium]|nr:glycosyl hydrolase 115 family protein [Lachnospiraceae bacterium]
MIAGSDKRGTIYGLFHLSECIGVSPLVDWSDVRPAKQEQVVLTEAVNMISRIPSVKYRGFFINDEWPAFGNWTTHHFGGFTATMYDHVFELLLRLKGNYLWPAMWSSNFSVDGPGLLSAELADEYGIVIGTSHHEPCIRHGEEYSQVRGKDSIYGDAWNYITNREGILKFWEDGLKRNGKFENIITLGMRGERDSAILEQTATLADNIALLHDVFHEQNRLLKEYMNESLDEVRRLFVLFSEVDAFFYGDDKTPGLIGDPELDGVTLMLCDDNFGNVRSLPDERMRGHNGGFGLYYHLDFHGGPHSYEWTNSSYLPKMWEQLSMAYEYGIEEIWIANVGDISMQEYPLSFFMDMAYDMDTWGEEAPNRIEEYTERWIQRQFQGSFTEADCETIHKILNGYTKLNHNRRPEIMNSTVYHPVHFGEAKNVLRLADWIEEQADRLKDICIPETLPSYYELVYYPSVASVNVQRMQVLATMNEYYARQGRVEANDYADQIAACIERDRELTIEYHSIGDGKWYGMGLSEHIGFVNWCEEGCRYPLMMRMEPSNKPRIIVAPSNSVQYTEGGPWCGRKLYVNDFLQQGVEKVEVDIACGSREPVVYEVSTECPWLELSTTRGCVTKKDVLTLTIDRSLLKGRDIGEVYIKTATSNICIQVEAENRDSTGLEPMTFLEAEGYIAIEAEHFMRKKEAKGVSFHRLDQYGRTMSAMKAIPSVYDFTETEDRPYLEYCFVAEQEGVYHTDIYLAPSNTAFYGGRMYLGIQTNDEDIQLQNTVSEGFRAFDYNCQDWVSAVINNIRVFKTFVNCRKGINHLRIYAVSPALVLEKIVLYQQDKFLPESYLGPLESYYIQ